jgi:hypothetical protein
MKVAQPVGAASRLDVFAMATAYGEEAEPHMANHRVIARYRHTVRPFRWAVSLATSKFRLTGSWK